jgi:hypothetical protein
LVAKREPETLKAFRPDRKLTVLIAWPSYENSDDMDGVAMAEEECSELGRDRTLRRRVVVRYVRT